MITSDNTIVVEYFGTQIEKTTVNVDAVLDGEGYKVEKAIQITLKPVKLSIQLTDATERCKTTTFKAAVNYQSAELLKFEFTGCSHEELTSLIILDETYELVFTAVGITVPKTTFTAKMENTLTIQTTLASIYKFTLNGKTTENAIVNVYNGQTSIAQYSETDNAITI